MPTIFDLERVSVQYIPSTKTWYVIPYTMKSQFKELVGKPDKKEEFDKLFEDYIREGEVEIYIKKKKR